MPTLIYISRHLLFEIPQEHILFTIVEHQYFLERDAKLLHLP